MVNVNFLHIGLDGEKCGRGKYHYINNDIYDGYNDFI